MSYRQQIFITSGVLIMVMLSMGFNYYSLTVSNQNIETTKDMIIEGRQAANVRGNITLGAAGELIRGQNDIVRYILGNLTAHRIVTNATFAYIENVISKFNNTNEVKRTEAVNDIKLAIQQNNDLLKRLINLSPNKDILNNTMR